MDPAGVWALLLLAAGLLMILVEVFIPSGGLIAAITVAIFVASGVFAHQAWATKVPWAWWAYMISVPLLIPTMIVFAFSYLPHTPFGRQILLEPPAADSVSPDDGDDERLRAIVGKRGVASTPLRPTGSITIDGRRYSAASRGLFIEAGNAVQVVAVERGTALVKTPEPGEPPPAVSSPPAMEDPLGFDFGDPRATAETKTG